MTCLIVVLVVLGIVAIVTIMMLTHKETFVMNGSNGDDTAGDFYIYNHLLVPIRLNSEGREQDVQPNDRVKANFDFQNVLISILLPGEVKRYCQYLRTDGGDVHVGMITSRWVSRSVDDTAIPPNAQQGRPYIKIHNMTVLPIELNDNIKIAPQATLLYKGRDHYGVRLGTILRNPLGIFPTWKFITPATDIYYGVVSSVHQKPFGGWQHGIAFKDVPDDEVHHVLEGGFKGGPAKGDIQYDALPRDGETANRWGEQM